MSELEFIVEMKSLQNFLNSKELRKKSKDLLSINKAFSKKEIEELNGIIDEIINKNEAKN